MVPSLRLCESLFSKKNPLNFLFILPSGKFFTNVFKSISYFNTDLIFRLLMKGNNLDMNSILDNNNSIKKILRIKQLKILSFVEKILN